MYQLVERDGDNEHTKYAKQTCIQFIGCQSIVNKNATLDDEDIFESVYILTELLYHDLEKNDATDTDYVSEFLDQVPFDIRV